MRSRLNSFLQSPIQQPTRLLRLQTAVELLTVPAIRALSHLRHPRIGNLPLSQTPPKSESKRTARRMVITATAAARRGRDVGRVTLGMITTTQIGRFRSRV